MGWLQTVTHDRETEREREITFSTSSDGYKNTLRLVIEHRWDGTENGKAQDII